MIKGIKKPLLSIKDKKVLEFMSNIGVDYWISDVGRDTYFEFVYQNTGCIFYGLDIPFETFILEFAERFYSAGYRDCIEQVHSDMHDVMSKAEDNMDEDWLIGRRRDI